MGLPILGAMFRRRSPEHRTRVEVDEAGVRCIRPEGSVDEVGWDELRSVAIETNDGGPFIEDVYFHLVGPSYSFSVPQSARGTQELVRWLVKLPGFDGEAFSAAMCSTGNAKFPCWERPVA